SRGYKYDLNGNMISSAAGHFEYTSDNHLRLLYLDQAKWSKFDYGPSGRRFRQFSRNATRSEETVYVGLFEKIVDYSIFGNINYLSLSKQAGFGRFSRSRHYLVNSSGVFAFIETDETYANSQIS